MGLVKKGRPKRTRFAQTAFRVNGLRPGESRESLKDWTAFIRLSDWWLVGAG